MGQELQVLLGTGLQANTSSHITNESEKLKITEFVNKTKANKLNHLTLLFLINYLQKFCVPHIVAETKMNEENLATIFAPNIFRKPDTTIYSAPVMCENQKSETALLKALIKWLDTSNIDGVI